MSKWRAIRFGTRITLLGIGIVLLTTLALLSLVAWQSTRYNALAEENVGEETSNNLESVTLGIYHSVMAHAGQTQQQVDSALHVARFVLEQAGAVSLAQDRVSWTATNQLSQETVPANLPKMLVGGTWLGQNNDLAVPTAVVDQVVALTGGTATIFQRMNEQGDMLRVATNVPTADGKRAVGTFIPATNLDGTPNPVIAAILSGQDYHGLAFVVNDWYITAYTPLYDSWGDLVGMLYVGIKQENVQTLRQVILETKVEESGGRIYILGGSGDFRGRYIISPGGTSDGANMWDAQAPDGSMPFQTIVQQGVALAPGKAAPVRYLWQDPGEEAPHWRVATLAYYKDWDWVIVVDVREDEILEYQEILRDGRASMLRWSGGIGFGLALLIGALCFFLSQLLTRPLRHLTDVAGRISAGDLEASAQVTQQDEFGALASSFNAMTDRLRTLINDLQQRIHTEQAIVSRYAKHMATVGQGNLAARVDLEEGQAGEALAELGLHLNEMTANLQHMIVRVRQAADAVGAAAAEILTAATQQASGAAEQSAAITQAGSTIDEVRMIADQTTQRAQGVAELSQRTTTVSRAGQQAVDGTLHGMQEISLKVDTISHNILALSEQSQAIGRIIAAVNDLAAQSNLLALNAAVEAARAGEAGKGFAIVAGEVRSLAEQSRAATSQVRDILLEIQGGVNTAVMATEEGLKGVRSGQEQAGEAGQAIHRLGESVTESAQSALQIVAAAQQQLTGMEQIAMAMSNIQQVTSETVAGTRQTQSAAEELARLAEDLRAAVEKYAV